MYDLSLVGSEKRSVENLASRLILDRKMALKIQLNDLSRE
jgi:hypothetical protein